MKQKLTLSVADLGPMICVIRGHRVMFDNDLATLYGVDTGQLNRAVSRNRERFPDDFMFQLTTEELAILKCQFGISKSPVDPALKSPSVTSKDPRGGRRRSRPYAFTQEGIAMLSSVLRSGRAVEVNVAIMRAFVRLREMTLGIGELARKVEALERGFAKHGEDFKVVFDALRQLMTPPEKPRRKIGFNARD